MSDAFVYRNKYSVSTWYQEDRSLYQGSNMMSNLLDIQKSAYEPWALSVSLQARRELL